MKQKGEFDKILGRGGGPQATDFLSPCFKLPECHILTYQLPQEARRSSLPFFFSLKKKKKKFFLFFYFPSCVKGGNSDRDK